MEKQLISIVASQGAWAALFLALLRYVLKTNDKRENRYLRTIDDLTNICTIMQDVHKDVCEIKDMLK